MTELLRKMLALAKTQQEMLFICSVALLIDSNQAYASGISALDTSSQVAEALELFREKESQG